MDYEMSEPWCMAPIGSFVSRKASATGEGFTILYFQIVVLTGMKRTSTCVTLSSSKYNLCMTLRYNNYNVLYCKKLHYHFVFHRKAKSLKRFIIKFFLAL